MQTTTVRDMFQAYGVRPLRLLQMQKGYRNQSYAAELNDGSHRNLIIYKNEPGILLKIRCANAVGSFLAARDIPARAPADPRILRLSNAGQQRYAGLYTYLPGRTIPWEAYTQTHLKALGAAMGTLHHSLRSMPQGRAPLVAREYLAIVDRMRRYFADPQVSAAAHAKLQLHVPANSLARQKHALRRIGGLPGQWLHMDFVRSNILFEGGRMSGIVDFEKAAWGHPLFDTARTLAFLLVDCKYKTEAQVRKDFLLSGYSKRSPNQFRNIRLGSDRLDVLETLIDIFLTYDLYKFMRHNPYESLAQNEHYTRTRDFLLKRNIIARSQMLK